MSNKVTSVKDVLKEIEGLDIKDQAYILDILNKRLIESRRMEIAKRGKEAEQAYKEGAVKTGTFEDLWKGLNPPSKSLSISLYQGERS
ncbi:MAG: hypothetical protein HW384_1404 [Dehalococcoidia bacterium]|nr:hypothetical protein [Dehalococcoidia bacterium]